MAGKNRGKKGKKGENAVLGDNDVQSDATRSRLLTSAQVIERLGITRSTFVRWMRMGRLRGVKVGRTWRFDEGPIAALLEGPKLEDVTVGVEADEDICFFGKRLKKKMGKITDSSQRIEALTGLIIDDAIQSRGSDIHLQVWKARAESVYCVSFRIDGVLHQIRNFKPAVYQALVKRFKVMAQMDLTENFLPMDGRMSLNVRGRQLDIRINIIPGVLGDSVCLRILDPDAVSFSLEQLALAPEILDKFKPLLNRSHGLIIVNGPTGSGKTTTLYSALKYITRPEVKIMSVEDPVEYLLGGCTQVAVNPARGLTFETVARSFMRQDPDVILVGEIRNSEIAQVCSQAALTGHLVLTTLHSDSSAGALIRLLDIGVDPFLIGDAVIGVLDQRLIRVLCNHCKEERAVDVEDQEVLRAIAMAGALELPADRLRAGYPVGCDKCRQTGYRGRRAVNELLVMDRKIGLLLRGRAPFDEIHQAALDGGMKSLAANAVAMALAGQTSLAEVFRVSESCGRSGRKQ